MLAGTFSYELENFDGAKFYHTHSLMMANSAYRLGRRCWNSPQHCYQDHLHTLNNNIHNNNGHRHCISTILKGYSGIKGQHEYSGIVLL